MISFNLISFRLIFNFNTSCHLAANTGLDALVKLLWFNQFKVKVLLNQTIIEFY
jgi:hypothetical protein